jgi:hypothetical protein
VSIQVSPSSATHLVDVGGRFQHGLHVEIRGDRATAWIPEQGRTASGPPKFAGVIKPDVDDATLTGVIREARIDQFNAVLWGCLAVLGLLFVALGVVAEVQDESGGLLALVFGIVLVLLCTLFAVSGQRGRAKTFATKASTLESSLRDWAGPPQPAQT